MDHLLCHLLKTIKNEQTLLTSPVQKGFIQISMFFGRKEDKKEQKDQSEVELNNRKGEKQNKDKVKHKGPNEMLF